MTYKVMGNGVELAKTKDKQKAIQYARRMAKKYRDADLGAHCISIKKEGRTEV